MSLKGGYQIINLKNLEFNSEMGNSERYPDIYFNMVNSHAKMIIVSGLNMDGVKYNDYETIFYEKDDGDGMYFQAIARRIWNTRDYKCITKYINIFSDDRVTCSQDEFVYEILPDGELSLTSTNALQNKVITQNINRIDGVNNEQNERLLDVENENTLQNKDIASNTSERNRDAVLTAIYPQVKLVNMMDAVISQTANLYKYSNGLIILSFTDVYTNNEDFYSVPLKNIIIEDYYSEEPAYAPPSPVFIFADKGEVNPISICNNDFTSLVISCPEGGIGYIAPNTQISRTFHLIITTKTTTYN